MEKMLCARIGLLRHLVCAHYETYLPNNALIWTIF